MHFVGLPNTGFPIVYNLQGEQQHNTQGTQETVLNTTENLSLFAKRGCSLNSCAAARFAKGCCALRQRDSRAAAALSARFLTGSRQPMALARLGRPECPPPHNRPLLQSSDMECRAGSASPPLYSIRQRCVNPRLRRQRPSAIQPCGLRAAVKPQAQSPRPRLRRSKVCQTMLRFTATRCPRRRQYQYMILLPKCMISM
jgi:hypothetical protein